jgi:hypothetical protein
MTLRGFVDVQKAIIEANLIARNIEFFIGARGRDEKQYTFIRAATANGVHQILLNAPKWMRIDDAKGDENVETARSDEP